MRILTFFLILVAGPMSLSGLLFSTDSVVFRSLESALPDGNPVFNRIKFISGWNQDIWLMQQSHSGLSVDFKNWDRLAIIVDKTRKPMRARFFQFVPGELKLPSVSEAAPYKARCFACHPNGPRAVRWDRISAEARPTLQERAQISLWNLRIKTYGKVDSVPGQEIAGGAPFRSRHPIFAQTLKLKSCTRCHAETGIRNPLKLEQISTAHFLVQKGFMPPFPFQADPSDVENLNRLTGRL